MQRCHSTRVQRGRVIISLSQAIGQCDARPIVTFPAAQHHCPMAGTNLYCLVTEAHVCEQLAQERPGLKPVTYWL